MKIDEAVKILNQNKVVAIPTETVYGLAAKIDSDEALNLIFSTKNRPFFDPLIVHIESKESAKKLSLNWNDACEKLADTYWPGPLTIITKKSDQISDLITSGLETVGLRVPNHPLTLDLLKKVKTPLAAPSANPFKATSPSRYEHVVAYFPELPVLNGGDCEVGIESTIVEVKGNEIVVYRPGMISLNDIKTTLGSGWNVTYGESPAAPGQLKEHYIPSTPIISCTGLGIGEVIDYLETNESEYIENPYIWNLISTPELTARNLYSTFRSVDQGDFTSLIINIDQKFSENTKWHGILNRLEKARTLSLQKEVSSNKIVSQSKVLPSKNK